jgi:VWFA-related protein
MRCTRGQICSTIVCVIFAVANIFAQQSSPTPPISEETIRIETEEVHLTVHAQGAAQGVALKLRPGDLSVYEDGVEQTIASMRNVPASVMVLVDTGAALTFVKSSETARLMSKLVIGNLPEGTSFSVVQYSERTETIADWSDDRADVFARIDSSVALGRRSMLTDALDAATKTFSSRPIENRHLILVTDGLHGSKAVNPESAELRQLAAANIVLHVVSLAGIEQAGAEQAGKIIKFNTKPSRPRIPQFVLEDILRGLSIHPLIREEVKAYLRAQNEGTRWLIIDLDRERKRMLNGRRDEWKKAEEQLVVAAAETGGSVSKSADLTELWIGAAEIARAIGMHYSLTYMPSVTATGEPKPRSVKVTTGIEGITVRTRKMVVLAK